MNGKPICGCCVPCWCVDYKYPPANLTERQSYCWCGWSERIACACAVLFCPLLFACTLWGNLCNGLYPCYFAGPPPLTLHEIFLPLDWDLCCSCWMIITYPLCTLFRPIFQIKCEKDPSSIDTLPLSVSHRCFWCSKPCWVRGYFPNARHDDGYYQSMWSFMIYRGLSRLPCCTKKETEIENNLTTPSDSGSSCLTLN